MTDIGCVYRYVQRISNCASRGVVTIVNVI
jgi:hypothetical protein